jgi:hypothetical protein
MRVFKWFERLGYLRAAGELQRLGYPDLAAKLKKQAKELE